MSNQYEACLKESLFVKEKTSTQINSKTDRKLKKGENLWVSWELDSYQTTNLSIFHNLYFTFIYWNFFFNFYIEGIK